MLQTTPRSGLRLSFCGRPTTPIMSFVRDSTSVSTPLLPGAGTTSHSANHIARNLPRDCCRTSSALCLSSALDASLPVACLGKGSDGGFAVFSVRRYILALCSAAADCMRARYVYPERYMDDARFYARTWTTHTHTPATLRHGVVGRGHGRCPVLCACVEPGVCGLSDYRCAHAALLCRAALHDPFERRAHEKRRRRARHHREARGSPGRLTCCGGIAIHRDHQGRIGLEASCPSWLSCSPTHSPKQRSRERERESAVRVRNSGAVCDITARPEGGAAAPSPERLLGAAPPRKLSVSDLRVRNFPPTSAHAPRPGHRQPVGRSECRVNGRAKGWSGGRWGGQAGGRAGG